MDQYISFPVTDRKSFIEYKKGYNLGDTENRYPKDWENIKNNTAGSTKPLCLLDPAKGSFGFYSMLRNWIGTEGLSYLFYDDPVLVQECIEFLCEFAIQVMKKAVCQIKFDLYWVHEDMCYNSGPLVSPAIFKKMFLASNLNQKGIA